MKEKNNKGVNLLLVILVVALAVLCFLFATGIVNFKNDTTNDDSVNDKPETTNVKTYSYKELAGLYSYTETLSSQDGENLNETFDLLLNDDGTYFYSDAVRVSMRHIGNYIIEGNNIIINKIYSVSDGPSITPSFETITMTINENGQILYNTKINFGNNGAKDIALAKQDEASKNNFVNKYAADKEKLLKNS